MGMRIGVERADLAVVAIFISVYHHREASKIRSVREEGDEAALGAMTPLCNFHRIHLATGKNRTLVKRPLVL